MGATVGILGCGRMGSAIGGHLLAAGTTLAAYDTVAAAMRPLVDAGARGADSPGDVAARSDVVLVVVVDDMQARDAVHASLETARPGTLVAICASVRPDTCQELARAGVARGIEVIDAALVRGERGAEEGRLVLYCGGPEEAVARLRDVARPFAEHVLRVGDVGAGQVAKTANNVLLWACIRADYEALRLARALGVEPRTLREALELGSGANRPLAEWGSHRLRWPGKDLEVACAIAADAGVEVPLVAELSRLMERLGVDDLRGLL